MNDECGYWTSSKNACEIFGVTGNTIRRWADSNRISYVDFFESFVLYKKQNDPDYILTHPI